MTAALFSDDQLKALVQTIPSDGTKANAVVVRATRDGFAAIGSFKLKGGWEFQGAVEKAYTGNLTVGASAIYRW